MNGHVSVAATAGKTNSRSGSVGGLKRKKSTTRVIIVNLKDREPHHQIDQEEGDEDSRGERSGFSSESGMRADETVISMREGHKSCSNSGDKHISCREKGDSDNRNALVDHDDDKVIGEGQSSFTSPGNQKERQNNDAAAAASARAAVSDVDMIAASPGKKDEHHVIAVVDQNKNLTTANINPPDLGKNMTTIIQNNSSYVALNRTDAGVSVSVTLPVVPVG